MTLSARQRPEFMPHDLPCKRALLVSAVLHAALLWGTTAWWHKAYHAATVPPQVIEVDVIERAAAAPATISVPEPQQPSRPASAPARPVPIRVPPQAQKVVQQRQPTQPVKAAQASAAATAEQVGDRRSPADEPVTAVETLRSEAAASPAADIQATANPAPERDRASDLSQAYQRQLKELIERHKQYPLIARKGGQQGRVVVEFSLNQAGEVLLLQLAQSSGHRLLDRAALKAVGAVTRFPPPPDLLPAGTPFRIAISFTLE